jgi:uncharacterized lipoprotein YbaY
VSGAQPAFASAVDPGLLDPAATYVVRAAIVDGAAVWENREGVPGIADGRPVTDLDVPVTRVGTDLPVVPSPTPPPTQPTALPTGEPTAEPTAVPTEAPTAAPTATPSPSPSPSPTPSPSATSAPITSPLTGTLTYAEPQGLSGGAFAAVALVRGSARPDESSIVASEILRDIGQKPVAFELAFNPEVIDPTATYTVQATIVDGANAWVTGRGVAVLTKGAPSDVDITLSYRPDLVKGSVNGQITAVGLQPAADAYAIAVLVDLESGASLGMDIRLTEGQLPVAFDVPFDLTGIDQARDYVIGAEVGDSSGTTWKNVAGVPVITKGNPTTGVQVVVTEVLAPTPTATPSPVATPVPEPSEDSTAGLSPLVAIIIIGAVVAVAAAVIAKLRNG